MRITAEDLRRYTLVAVASVNFKIYSVWEQIKIEMQSSAWQENGEHQTQAVG